jgi:hypothetical protein
MTINSRLLACKTEIGQALYYAKPALRVGPYFKVFNPNPVDSITYFKLASYIERSKKATRGGGVNGSQSKFLTGTWPISRNRTDTPLF